MILLVFLLSISLTSSASAKQIQFVICQLGRHVRTIRVDVDKDTRKGCRTTYTKRGVDHVVGSGLYSHSCVGFLENVQENLQKASWKCRSLKKPAVVVMPPAQGPSSAKAGSPPSPETDRVPATSGVNMKAE